MIDIAITPSNTLPMGKLIPNIRTFFIVPEFLEVFNKFDIPLPARNNRSIDQSLLFKCRYNCKSTILIQIGLFDSGKNPGKIGNNANRLLFAVLSAAPQSTYRQARFKPIGYHKQRFIP